MNYGIIQFPKTLPQICTIFFTFPNKRMKNHRIVDLFLENDGELPIFAESKTQTDEMLYRRNKQRNYSPFLLKNE